MNNADADVLVIGSGVNSLICAALLAKKGLRTIVLERESVAGGCIRTEELTLPGFVHDTLSTLYPLFVTSPAFPLLEKDLSRYGVRFRNLDTPTAVLLEDGRSLCFSRNREANIEAFERCAPGDGEAYQRSMASIEQRMALISAVLGDTPRPFNIARHIIGELRRNGLSDFLRFVGRSMSSARNWSQETFSSEIVRALFVPWVLHVGLAPESAGASLMNKLVMLSLEGAGSPMVEGGGARLVEALTRIIEAGGGAVRCNSEVAQISVSQGRAAGVMLADGETLCANRAVAANVTPQQLYQKLLPRDCVPQKIYDDAAQFRYGRGEMQIHLALDSVPSWPDAQLRSVGMLHLTGGAESVSKAVNEAERGLLPADPTIVIAQPAAIDPDRAPKGKWIFWVQLQELPRDGQLRGDALGDIKTPPDGRWTEDCREAYADRVVARLDALIPGLKDQILARRVFSPADLESMNVNLVGGDPYSGSCELDQFLFWRPLKDGRTIKTPVKQLFHIGASTHPGPGLGGVSGYLAAGMIA